jgi:hypothetical protein
VRKMRRDSATMPPTTPLAIAPTGVEEDSEEGGGDVELDAADAVDDVESESGEAGGVAEKTRIEDGAEEVVDAIVAGSNLISHVSIC